MRHSVGHRILFGFVSVIALFACLGAHQLSNVRNITDISSSIAETELSVLRRVGELGYVQREKNLAFEYAWTAHLLRKQGLIGAVPYAQETRWRDLGESAKALIANLTETVSAQEKMAGSEARRRILTQLRQVAAAEQQTTDTLIRTEGALIALMRANSFDQVAAQHDTILELRAEVVAQGQQTVDLTEQLASMDIQRILDLQDRMQTLSLLALCGVIGVAAVVALWLLRSITKRLQCFNAFVERVGAGDLTENLESVEKDEIGRLGLNLNVMAQSLGELAKQTRAATDNLNSAAAEMQATIQQQASGASEQNAAIQQITSTLSEISHSGSQVSERARAVANSAETAAAASKDGLHAVSETSRLMSAIREQAESVAGNVVALTEKTQSIALVISTVNELAERSNLLAFNAAIEAAAAGEHGQSFSVVAEEIRNLAGQAKEATVEVRAILNDIQRGIGTAVMQTEEAVKRVESGKKQAAASEQTIMSLVRNVEQSVATFEQIVAATSQQQVGIEQVTQSIHGIREASTQMAMGTRDVGRVAANVSALSAQLQRVVERYRV